MNVGNKTRYWVRKQINLSEGEQTIHLKVPPTVPGFVYSSCQIATSSPVAFPEASMWSNPNYEGSEQSFFTIRVKTTNALPEPSLLSVQFKRAGVIDLDNGDEIVYHKSVYVKEGKQEMCLSIPVASPGYFISNVEIVAESRADIDYFKFASLPSPTLQQLRLGVRGSKGEEGILIVEQRKLV